jgi:Domain of unknown function (DUF4167)
MRTGQYNNNNNNNNNKNRNRNRNRRPNTGGGGGQTGGNGANRVYDSNGPDVKLRGTAQTIAEKYMQLARDAQSSGDNVAAESYFQFADHYYRVWLAAQPVGQPLQFSRRMAEDEYDEDGNEVVTEVENEPHNSDQQDNGDAPAADAGEASSDGENQGSQNRQNIRNDRQNSNNNFNSNSSNNSNNTNNNRDGGNNRNSRPRWPRRNERYNQDGQSNGNPVEAQSETGERQERFERPVDEPVVVRHREVEAPDNGNWEAPSFLTRPTPIIAAEIEPVVDAAPAPRPRGRKPRVVAPAEDGPQGE